MTELQLVNSVKKWSLQLCRLVDEWLKLSLSAFGATFLLRRHVDHKQNFRGFFEVSYEGVYKFLNGYHLI